MNKEQAGLKQNISYHQVSFTVETMNFVPLMEQEEGQ
jgi:hypothetical protein